MTAIVQSMALILLFETRFVQAISSDVTVYNSDVVRQSPMHVNISKPCKSRPTAMVGTRSRGSRGRMSDNDLRCSASERRWFPARPARHVHRRRNNGKGQNTMGPRERAWHKWRKTGRDMPRRTRRSVSTLGGAAPDTTIGRAAADRAGARPYRAHVAKTRRNVPRRIAWNASPRLG